jgi:hypothetical protein
MSQYNYAMGTLGELLKNDKERGLAFDPMQTTEDDPYIEELRQREEDARMVDWEESEIGRFEEDSLKDAYNTLQSEGHSFERKDCSELER